MYEDQEELDNKVNIDEEYNHKFDNSRPASHRDYNAYFEKLEHQETTKLLKNSIRQVKKKIIRDKNYIDNLNSNGPERLGVKRPQSSIKLSIGNSNNLDKINLVELAFKRKIQETFKEKEAKRNKTLQKFENKRKERLIIKQKENERKHAQSKEYFKQFLSKNENNFQRYLQKDQYEKAKVEQALQQKRSFISNITKMNQFKLNCAKAKYETFLKEKEEKKQSEYNKSKDELIKNFYSYKEPGKKNDNFLDILKKSGKLDSIEKNYNKNLLLIKTKLSEKEQKSQEMAQKCALNKEKEKMKRVMNYETKKTLAERNRLIINKQKESKHRDISIKYDLISSKVKMSKESMNTFYLEKVKFDELRKQVKNNFEKLLHSKKQFSESELKSILISLIPSYYSSNQDIIDEIEDTVGALSNYNPKYFSSKPRSAENVSIISIKLIFIYI